MSEVTITVRGEHEIRVAPERATIHLTVRAEGPEREAAVSTALARAEPLRASITARAEKSAVTEWTSTALVVRAERPWNSEGKRLAPVYYASVDFTATFAEASELSLWVTEVATADGIELGAVRWSLTPETRARLDREVAAAAVDVAVSRAGAYARALGLTSVIARELADLGLLSRDSSAEAAPMARARGIAFASADSAPTMSYEPEDIVVSAGVEARFLAS